MTPRSRLPFYIAVFLLIAAGISLAIWRHIELGIPWLSGEQRPVWMIEARVDFDANSGAVLASLNVPENPPGFRILSEQAASPGYGFSIIEKNGSRRAEWTKRNVSGRQTLYFKTQFIPDDSAIDRQPTPEPKARKIFWEEPQATAVREVLAQAEERSSTPESMTRELIRFMQPDTRTQNTTLLVSEENYLDLLVDMLNHSGIPARTADGLKLEDARRRQSLMPFLQIFNGEQWLTFDPNTAEQGVPESLLLWRQGSASLLDVVGGDNSEVSFSMLRQTVPALQLATMEFDSNGLGFLSFYELPIEEQSMFRMLLLLPLGALMVAFMRIVIGIRTSGTFMPVLIAVAFVQTTLVPGLIAFLSVVSIGLMMRGYLSSLNLLLVSRISALIILVIFITAGLSIIGYQMGFNTGMTVTFFPMVIIAWTIERMSILWEEEGAHEVLIQGAGSMFVAICAYLLMSAPLAGHLTFNFPELHLVILGLILLMGQYTGYKLSELKRFTPMKAYD
ncbi:inactive transglutaminase family protein [Marinobacter sp. M216]|uniref:Inactive transglutaminase family protein n=1 Tax=Marinobacter albus TaxID=3030833 RepID=A0ABT7HHL2_9GAMM|nr:MULTISPECIES: inactive transglutaminase family protein [unclassified Marinobacter]MBW7472491.1 inactive transglutaminase family protein [Marinobacter sp. F4218]MDK9559041.1 inactive transglutaminase family protein [Marinobacter sp. M216]